ncbi:MAG: hypothetical protein N2999_02070 [Proteobacteria bacterium]|nr:hypothetical protein [Pseudomonadota bacterium]
MKRFIILSIISIFLFSCSSIEFNEISPSASLFKPSVVVLLPVKMPDGYDHDVTKAEKAVYDNAMKTKKFEKIISPENARQQMNENKELQESIMAYFSKLKTLGISDKDLSKRICDLYLADTIIVAEFSKWGYIEYLGDKFGEVSASIKLIDGATGTIYWKAMHQEKESYSLFKPDLGKIADKVLHRMFKNMPDLPEVKKK